MGYAANHHHQGLWPADMTRTHKRPELPRARLEEVGYEQIEEVPGCRYDDPGTKPPRTVSSCEHNNSDINQCLEEVEKA